MQGSPGSLKRLLRYTLDHKKLMLTAVLLVLLSTAADVLGPVLIKIFIDDYLIPDQWNWREIIWLIVAYVCANVIAAYLSYVQVIKLSDIA
ncbi:MAG: hypothetical protein MI976_24390 [Pseudomonadales bacterium]|nr:hypothetical protein [Pseudomonadales bacterium]